MANPSKRSVYAGLVLAGGQSIRFGREKAVAELAGKTLLDWVLDGVAAASARVAVSAPPGSATEALAKARSLPVVHDRMADGRGPLAGVRAGLEWAASQGAQWMFTWPCDVPVMPEDALDRLAEAADSAGGAFATTSRGAESLCAVWPVSGLAVLRVALEGGAHPPVRHVHEKLNAVPVFFAGDVLRNVNTPDDLNEIESEQIEARSSR